MAKVECFCDPSAGNQALLDVEVVGNLYLKKERALKCFLIISLQFKLQIIPSHLE